MSVLFLKYLFIILHVVTAAGWFGLALRIASQARLVLNLDRTAASEMAEQTDRTIRMMGVLLLLTLVFSLAAFFLGGGFKAYGVPFHTSVLLIVLLLAVQYGMIAPSWRKISRGVTAGEPNSAGTLTAARKRLSAGVGIGHVLWVTLLVLMFWTRLSE